MLIIQHRHLVSTRYERSGHRFICTPHIGREVFLFLFDDGCGRDVPVDLLLQILRSLAFAHSFDLGCEENLAERREVDGGGKEGIEDGRESRERRAQAFELELDFAVLLADRTVGGEIV